MLNTVGSKYLDFHSADVTLNMSGCMKLKEVFVNPIITLFSTISLMCSPAWATGDTYIRTIDLAQIGAVGVIPGCSGRTYEILKEWGNVHGGGDWLSIVCANSVDTATWVLISGTECYDNSDAEDSTKCSKARSAPDFVVRSNWYEDKSPPYRMQYQLIKYAIGRECQIVSQRYTSTNTTVPNGSESRWICKKLDIFDGTNNSKGRIVDSQPLLSIKVETVSARPLVSDSQPDAAKLNFPEEFIIPGRMYIYSPLTD
jgi:hypothetical protein